MTSPNFAAFYRAIHNRDPFPWQDRLATQVLSDGTWPPGIGVPTACGKTSVLDIAVFALAKQADIGLERTAPLRIFFVVDRRLVVDDVTAHAMRIREALLDPKDDATRWAGAQLRKFGVLREPLAVATLRGGMYRSDSWADEPIQPLICASTVDQVGSRLLFRGYGVSEERRPVDAGLTGNDALIILDEAHLSNAFLTTLRAVCEYQSTNGEKGRPLQIVEMSATARHSKQSDACVTLTADDVASEQLGARLSNEKRVALKEAPSLEATAAQEAVALQSEDTPVVGVVLNTVAAAQKTFNLLSVPDHQKLLLTGRIRPYDRDALLEKYLDRIKATPQRRDREPLIVVATQTIEAGADLDFDALVTELAPLDCLIQRFGRVNRIGHRDRADGVILKPKRTKDALSIYGDKPEAAWNWLSKVATDGSLDFSAAALRPLLDSNEARAAMSPAEAAPFLLPAHLDAWVQTNPAPAEDPDVAPFLHGAVKSGDVQLVWRADLPESVADWRQVLAAAPPLTTEALPIPATAARRWLQRLDTGPVTDTEANPPQDDEEKPTTIRDFLIWRGPEKSSEEDGLGKIHAGVTIVVRSQEGGNDEFGWNPDSKKFVTDVGDECNNQRAAQGRGRYRIRLCPDVLYPPSARSDENAEEREALIEYLHQAADGDSEARDAIEDLALKRLPLEASKGRLIQGGHRFPVWVSEWPDRRKLGRTSPLASEAPPEESDENDASTFTVFRTLEAHSDAVTAKAKAYAAICLNKSDAAAVVAAAEKHDLGKLDDRFQMALDPWRKSPDPLAKSGRTDPSEYRRAFDLAGYPKGARHEFASVLLANQVPLENGTDRSLVAHLIGTHHGKGRPLVPFWRDDEDPEIDATKIEGVTLTARGACSLSAFDSGWIDQFWALNQTYGPWGLAYLEAIVRRADCTVSREEQEGNAK